MSQTIPLSEVQPSSESDLPSDYWEGELVAHSDPRSGIISVNPERLGGAPCFVGTRVPVQVLWDYLENGTDIAEFLDDYEGVSREEAVSALKMALQRLMAGLPGRPWR